MAATQSQAQLSPPAKDTASKPLQIPFVTASFADDLSYYLLLWPVWWALGIEQLLLPFFLGWEFLRALVQQQARFTLNRTALWALLLAIWSLVPVYSLDVEYLDLFVKEVATMTSQFFILFLFWNQVRTAGDWWRVARAVEILALYVALGSLIFLSGLWQGEFVSGVGRLLPDGLAESSSFFESIALRAFGGTDPGSGVLIARVSSFSLKYSGLSMISLMLIPFTVWRIEANRGPWRLINLFTLIGLFASLFYAESRVAYAAFLAGLALYVALRSGMMRGHNKAFSLAAGIVAFAALLVLVYIAYSAVAEAFQLIVFDWRPGSFFVRFRIYEETLRLLPEHWLAGWGTSIRIPNAPSNYSAGTHSSYLGMLFQHGIVGLAIYLLVLLSLWRVVLTGLKRPNKSRVEFTFWVAITAGLLAFNLREIADIWWWDQMSTIIVWSIWGLIVTAGRAFAATGHSLSREESGKDHPAGKQSTPIPPLTGTLNQERS